MPSRNNPKVCRYCRRTREQVGHISNRGICADCATERHAMNTAQLRDKRGPYARYWAARVADGLGLYPLDELPPKP